MFRPPYLMGIAYTLTAMAVNRASIISRMGPDIKQRFARRLKELRLKAGLSVSELAQCSRISRQHIRDLELSYPQKRATIVTLEKLAKGLQIPIWKLLQFKD